MNAGSKELVYPCSSAFICGQWFWFVRAPQAPLTDVRGSEDQYVAERSGIRRRLLKRFIESLVLLNQWVTALGVPGLHATARRKSELARGARPSGELS